MTTLSQGSGKVVTTFHHNIVTRLLQGSGHLVIFVWGDNHSHPSNQVEIEAEKLMSSLKKKVSETIQPVNVMYQNEILKLSIRPDMEEIAAKLPIIRSIKSSLYHERRKRLPPMSQTRAEVTFEGEWAQTLNGQPFLLVEDGEQDKIIIFSTIENLHTLAAATNIYVDGTFHTCNEVQPTVSTCILPSTKQDPRNI